MHQCNLQSIWSPLLRLLKHKTVLKQRKLKKSFFRIIFFGKTWSDFPTAPYTTIAEGIISLVMDCNHLYSCKWVDVSIFQVKFQGGPTVDGYSSTKINNNTEIISAPIPLFASIHTILVKSNKVMFCNCHSFETTGIFCVHMVCVYKYVTEAND